MAQFNHPLRRWLPLVVSGVVLAAFFIVARATYQRFPPVWPDEAVIADAAVYLTKTGRLGSLAFAGVYPGISTHWFGYPPGFEWLLAGVYTILPPTLSVTRGVSQMWALSALAGLGLCAWRLSGSRWLGAIAVALFALDPAVLRAANVARMDMASVALGLWGSFLYLSFQERPKRAAWLAFGAGLLAGLSFVMHWLGALVVVAMGVHYVVCERQRSFARASLWAMLGGVAVGMLPWAVTVLPSWDLFVTQFSRAAARKQLMGQSESLWRVARRAFEIYGPLAPVGFFFAAMLVTCGVAALVRRRASTWGYVFCAALATTAFGILFRELWYTLYFAPYLHLAALVTAFALWTGGRRLMRAGAELLVAGIAVVLAAALALVLSREPPPPTNLDRHQMAEQVMEHCPPGSHILIAAVPDPWFDLYSAGRGYVLYEFVPRGLKPEPDYEAKVLEGVDFIIDDSPWGLGASTVYGPFLRRRARQVLVLPAGEGAFRLYDVRSRPWPNSKLETRNSN